MNTSNTPTILLLEDDADQMALLIDLTLDEIKKRIGDVRINDKQRQKLQSIKIIKNHQH